MYVRHIERHEYEEADHVKLIAFGRTAQAPKNDADDPDAIYNSLVACFDDAGTITARARNIDYRCMFDGNEVFMSGLSGVASAAHARGRGRVRAIIRYLLQEDYARGVLLGALFPFSHAYYRRFGYALSSERQLIRVKTQSLHPFSSCSFDAHMHRLADGFADIRTITNRMSARYNLAMRLSDRQYRKACGGDPVLHGDYRFILYDAQGAPCAWLHYTDHAHRADAFTARVHALEYVDLPALLCAFGFLYGLRARHEYVEFPLPCDVNILRLLPEAKTAHCMRVPYGMARIVNVRAMLEQMHHPEGTGGYTIGVTDDILHENDGVFCVTYQGGKAAVSSAPHNKPDLRVSIGTLTQLVLGYISLDEAAVLPGVHVADSAPVLGRVFARKPTLLSYHF